MAWWRRIAYESFFITRSKHGIVIPIGIRVVSHWNKMVFQNNEITCFGGIAKATQMVEKIPESSAHGIVRKFLSFFVRGKRIMKDLS
jgi:hypothetical protein